MLKPDYKVSTLMVFVSPGLPLVVPPTIMILSQGWRDRRSFVFLAAV